MVIHPASCLDGRPARKFLIRVVDGLQRAYRLTTTSHLSPSHIDPSPFAHFAQNPPSLAQIPGTVARLTLRRMTKRSPGDPKPTWFRLSPASWAMVREEYLAGATAKQIAAKWKVSPTSIYRHAYTEGWTKEKHGDAVANASAAKVEAAAAERAAASVAMAEALEGDPEAMRRHAAREASRAMLEGRYGDAERLARLAVQLKSLAPPPPAPAEEAEAVAFIDRPISREDRLWLCQEIVTKVCECAKVAAEQPGAMRLYLQELAFACWKTLMGEEEDPEGEWVYLAVLRTAAQFGLPPLSREVKEWVRDLHRKQDVAEQQMAHDLPWERPKGSSFR